MSSDREVQQDVPLVLQEPLSLVSMGYGDMEALVLRGVLEYFNYRVEVHWVGSRKQFLEIMRGNVPTFHYVVLECHGDDDGIVVPFERPIPAAELKGLVNLPGRVVVNLGCASGTDAFAEAFLGGGCEAYIGPDDFPIANSALMFAIHLLYYLAMERPLAEAVEKAREHDEQCAMYRLHSRKGRGRSRRR